MLKLTEQRELTHDEKIQFCIEYSKFKGCSDGMYTEFAFCVFICYKFTNLHRIGYCSYEIRLKLMFPELYKYRSHSDVGYWFPTEDQESRLRIIRKVYKDLTGKKLEE